MKKIIILTTLVIAGVFAYNYFFHDVEAENTNDDKSLHFVVDSKVQVADAKRLGLNFGSWSNWGADIHARNIALNPGFESAIQRILVAVKSSGKNSFSDDEGWGYPNNFWKDAHFEVRTGKAAGYQGIITKSLDKGEKNLPQYFTDEELPQLNSQDIILITKDSEKNELESWWVDENRHNVEIETKDLPPETKGKQAAVLIPSKTHPAEIITYVDHLASKGGRFFLVNGAWRLSFWMKKTGKDADVRVQFSRLNGTTPFIVQNIHPTDEWQEYLFKFNTKEQGKPEILILNFHAEGENTRVLLDDVYLGPEDTNKTAFRTEVIDMLTKVKPAFLRNWQGQLGDSFENEIASPYKRRPIFVRTGGSSGNNSYLYSLPEFLHLCKQVHANPWLVVPTAFTDDEYFQYGQYLAQHASKQRFNEVFVEFGNENWNWLFKPQGIPYPEAHGKLAEKAFQKIKEGAGSQVNLKTIVNGQHVSPETSLAYLQSTPNAQYLAVAPYFFYKVNKGSSTIENLRNLFSKDEGQLKKEADFVQKSGKKLAIYEINLHTTEGDAPAAERNPYVAGKVSGSALAKHLLENILLKIQPQMVFSFTQFDTNTWDIKDTTPLWGIVRDLGSTKRLRPTGLATLMLNHTIMGTAHKITTQNPSGDTEKITGVAFSSITKWSAAFVNASDKPSEISIDFPDDNREIPNSLVILDSSSPFDTNEESELVKLKTVIPDIEKRTIHFTIGPWGFVVLPPTQNLQNSVN